VRAPRARVEHRRLDVQVPQRPQRLVAQVEDAHGLHQVFGRVLLQVQPVRRLAACQRLGRGQEDGAQQAGGGRRPHVRVRPQRGRGAPDARRHDRTPPRRPGLARGADREAGGREPRERQRERADRLQALAQQPARRHLAGRLPEVVLEREQLDEARPIPGHRQRRGAAVLHVGERKRVRPARELDLGAAGAGTDEPHAVDRERAGVVRADVEAVSPGRRRVEEARDVQPDVLAAAQQPPDDTAARQPQRAQADAALGRGRRGGERPHLPVHREVGAEDGAAPGVDRDRGRGQQHRGDEPGSHAASRGGRGEQEQRGRAGQEVRPVEGGTRPRPDARALLAEEPGARQECEAAASARLAVRRGNGGVMRRGR
jgi:hypothetical protein